MTTATFVKLTPEQRQRHEEREYQWLTTLVIQANDDSDPETQANAQTLLRNRGMEW